MKKLSSFKNFDLDAFLKGKRLVLKSVSQIDTNYFKGARAEVIIVEDNTHYGKDEDGIDIFGVNLWESFTVKMPGYTAEKISQLKLNKPVKIHSYTKASVWKPKGAFEEILSVEGVLVQINEGQHQKSGEKCHSPCFYIFGNSFIAMPSAISEIAETVQCNNMDYSSNIIIDRGGYMRFCLQK